jgi:hypothetical protein
MSAWWSVQDGNLYGAVAGSVVGVLGGLLGAAVGGLAPRGRGRAAVYAAFALMTAFGVVTLAAGLWAMFAEQPRHVWYPLVLVGGLVTVLFPGLFPVVRARYREAEMRRLEAEDLRRG